MRSIESLSIALTEVAGEDVDALSGQELRAELAELLTAVNRLNAEVSRRVDAFDARGLSVDDGCRSTAAWLRAFGRLSGAGASAAVKRARSRRRLPGLAAAATSGDISAEHVDRVVRLADRVGMDRAAEVESILTAAATRLDPVELGKLCDRVVAHVDPDGVQPDAAADFARRRLTLSPFDGMMLVHGQLDPEGGAVLTTALSAFMPPPGPGDARDAAQRRADALIEMARCVLRGGHGSTVGGFRPQVAVLVTPENLTRAGFGSSDPAPGGSGAGPGAAPSAGPGAGPELADPARLEWVGDIPDPLAQRIACDADVWRVVLDPANGQPLDVGRTHRLVPRWIRKALYARDQGCRFPACRAPAAWTDAHHLWSWADGGPTSLDNLILLCRWHHGLVHEGGWTIRLHVENGAVTATRPDGRPYEPPLRRNAADRPP